MICCSDQSCSEIPEVSVGTDKELFVQHLAQTSLEFGYYSFVLVLLLHSSLLLHLGLGEAAENEVSRHLLRSSKVWGR